MPLESGRVCFVCFLVRVKFTLNATDSTPPSINKENNILSSRFHTINAYSISNILVSTQYCTREPSQIKLRSGEYTSCKMCTLRAIPRNMEQIWAIYFISSSIEFRPFLRASTQFRAPIVFLSLHKNYNWAYKNPFPFSKYFSIFYGSLAPLQSIYAGLLPE